MKDGHLAARDGVDVGELPWSAPVSEQKVSAREFVESAPLQRLAHEDQKVRNRGFTHAALSVDTSWPEIDRCVRAVQIVERELRRAGRSWQLATDAAEAQLDATVFSSPGRFLDTLGGRPATRGHIDGSLRIRHLQGPPFAALLEPEGYLWAGLTSWPATSVAFALSTFGVPFDINVFSSCMLEGAFYADEQAALIALVGIPSKGLWKGSDTGVVLEIDEIKGQQTRFRAVGASQRPGSGGSVSSVSVVLHLIEDAGRHHVVVGTTRPY